MSKIGSYNLDLQEQANNFGFSTTQEALDAGYTIGGDCDEPKLIEPLESAHNAFEREKQLVIEGLKSLSMGLAENNLIDKDPIDRAIEFIKEAHD